MKHLFFILFLISGMYRLFAAEFDPSACPDLKVKIFQVHERWAVLYVSADFYNRKNFGFDEIELRHRFFKNKYWTNLTIEVAKGCKPCLRLAIPIKMEKKYVGHIFKLSTRKSGWLQKINKNFPWKADKVKKGVLVFESYTDSERKNILRTLKINLADNSAVLDNKPDKKLKTSWNINTLVLEGLPKGNDTFYIDCKIGPRGYRKINTSETVLKYPIGSHGGFFRFMRNFT